LLRPPPKSAARVCFFRPRFCVFGFPPCRCSRYLCVFSGSVPPLFPPLSRATSARPPTFLASNASCFFLIEKPCFSAFSPGPDHRPHFYEPAFFPPERAKKQVGISLFSEKTSSIPSFPSSLAWYRLESVLPNLLR